MTEFISFVFAWYNLPFTLALLLFLGLSALQFLGLGGEQDADIDADLDVDLDVEADVDLDADIEADTDIDTDTNGLPFFTALMGFLGVGKVPLTIILLLLLGGFGFAGWITNNILLNIFSSYPSWGIIPAILIGIVIGIVISSQIGGLLGKALPSKSTTATSLKRLVGTRGRVVSPQINDKYGQVKVTDKGSTLITVFAVTDPGKTPIKNDKTVLLVEYDEERKLFIVSE